ncbi:MAG: methylenetetrahydrofolate reductase [Clostridiales Family XIII bacterium]|jgi:methylenetetrahydrofolate reductase (NADPH)|nr:methylenetetrahydrofolate reductase [Clostridiales Family XIII bacterium]
MKITELLSRKRTFSFEVFPPKDGQPLEPLLATLDELYRFGPDFISCTYGAGGTNKGRNVEICGSVINSGHTALSHFTCIGGSRADLMEVMDSYTEIGIENVLALRGDLPAGWEGTRGDFPHADGLLAFLKEKRPSLCIGVAAYPEKHIEAPSFGSDIGHLKSKQANGADFMTTQLCHDIDALDGFIERVRAAGVTMPIIAGLMPVLFREGTIRMTLSNGCSIPRGLAEIIGRYPDSPADFKKAGKEYTARQIERLANSGIDGLHIYSMNRHEDISDILAAAGTAWRTDGGRDEQS